MWSKKNTTAREQREDARLDWVEIECVKLRLCLALWFSTYYSDIVTSCHQPLLSPHTPVHNQKQTHTHTREHTHTQTNEQNQHTDAHSGGEKITEWYKKSEINENIGYIKTNGVNQAE